jgi:hypothetical protein
VSAGINSAVPEIPKAKNAKPKSLLLYINPMQLRARRSGKIGLMFN